MYTMVVRMFAFFSKVPLSLVSNCLLIESLHIFPPKLLCNQSCNLLYVKIYFVILFSKTVSKVHNLSKLFLAKEKRARKEGEGGCDIKQNILPILTNNLFLQLGVKIR